MVIVVMVVVMMLARGKGEGSRSSCLELLGSGGYFIDVGFGYIIAASRLVA